MADILTDRIVQELSKLINPGLLNRENFSVVLGFSKADGNAAAIGAHLTMNLHCAFDKLLSKYVMQHGRNSESALQLRKIFLESQELKPCADFIEAELEKFNIPVPSDAVTLVDTSVSLPSPPCGTPELEKFNIPVPSDAVTLVDTPVSLPSPPCGTPAEVAEAAGGTKTGAKTKEYFATEILTDRIVWHLSRLIDPALFSPENLCVELGFTKAEGNAATIGANLTMYQHCPFDQLLSKYVMKHGRKSDSALQLRKIFLENEETKPCADLVKAELEKFNIPVPSDAETLNDSPVSLPNPPCGTPDEGAEAVGGSKTDAKTKIACKDPA